MITGSINLSALKHVMMDAKGQKGNVRGVFIPLEANDLEENEKNSCVYLNIVGFEMKEPKDFATHVVKQSLPKAIREVRTKEQLDAMPILGNLKTSDGSFQAASNNVGGDKTFLPDDDLPF